MAAPAVERTGGQRLDLVADRLSCPVCDAAVRRDGAVLRCSAGHAFDIARQGYVALLDGHARANTADTAGMVSARVRFLAGGHYAPIAAAIATVVPDPIDGLCIDIAGGIGYYLATVLDARPAAVGLCVDLSAPALRRAARAHPRVAAIASDVWTHLPLVDGSASVALSVFGPRNDAEITRILDGGGVLVTVTPTERHLNELVAALPMISVGADKRARLDRSLASFARQSTTAVEYVLHLGRSDVADLVLMGPSAHHISLDDLTERIDLLPDRTPVTVSVEVSLHRRRPDSDSGSHPTDPTTDGPDLGGVRTAKLAEG